MSVYWKTKKRLNHWFFVYSYRSQVELRKLKRNGIIIAEALARYMYNLSEKVILIFDYRFLFNFISIWIGDSSFFYPLLGLAKRRAGVQGPFGKVPGYFDQYAKTNADIWC